jgi:hypothetical protein
MARNLIAIKLDASKVEGLGEKLAAFDADKLGSALVDTLNEVTNETYDLSRKTILRGINLEKGYIDDKFTVEKATAKKPEASITANGELTNLSRYGAVRYTQPVKHPNRAKGDPGRGYAKGQKADGMAAEVTRGVPKSVGKKFVIPGKTDSSGNLIVFRGTGRTGAGRDPRRKTQRQGVQAVLGPSVYQLFRETAGMLQDEIADNLEAAIANRAEKEFLKAIE